MNDSFPQDGFSRNLEVTLCGKDLVYNRGWCIQTGLGTYLEEETISGCKNNLRLGSFAYIYILSCASD